MRSEKYGARTRKLYDAAIKAKNMRYECPKCCKKNLHRRGTALWECNSCETRFAGGAYSFRTEVGEIASRLINEYSKAK